MKRDSFEREDLHTRFERPSVELVALVSAGLFLLVTSLALIFKDYLHLFKDYLHTTTRSFGKEDGKLFSQKIAQSTPQYSMNQHA